MRPEIAEINSRYELMEDYILPDSDAVDRIWAMNTEEMAEYTQLKKLYAVERDILFKQLSEIVEKLEPCEIAETYIKACRLLQVQLSRFMRVRDSFCDEYYHVMVNAIYAQHVHTSSIFLQILADNIGEKVSPLIEFALEREPMQKKALDIVSQLKLIEFKPQAERLLGSKNTFIKAKAQTALDAVK